jgi:uncharacterized protein (DUF2236 family)
MSSDQQAVDQGFFGPASVSWRLHRDASAIPGAGRALLMQALNPHVMDVFLANSDYRDDPWGRLRRTGDYFRDIIYGDTATARRAGYGVQALHSRLEGVTDPETGRVYRAGDPDLLLWVHATAVDSFLTAYRRYGGPLTDREADRYVEEQIVAAELVGIDPADAPADQAELRAYLDGVTGLRLTPGSYQGMEMILFNPPIPNWLRPAWLGVAAAIVSILPPEIRAIYKLPWLTPVDPPLRVTVFAACRAYNAYNRGRRWLASATPRA